ncbi:hypothetical protein D3C85_1398920 [compost metagenome]
MIIEAGFFRNDAKSPQLVYGLSSLFPVNSKNCSRAWFSVGMSVSRPRARFSAPRSNGSPTRLLRSASVINSSISLPT